MNTDKVVNNEIERKLCGRGRGEGCNQHQIQALVPDFGNKLMAEQIKRDPQ